MLLGIGACHDARIVHRALATRVMVGLGYDWSAVFGHLKALEIPGHLFQGTQIWGDRLWTYTCHKHDTHEFDMRIYDNRRLSRSAVPKGCSVATVSMRCVSPALRRCETGQFSLWRAFPGHQSQADYKMRIFPSKSSGLRNKTRGPSLGEIVGKCGRYTGGIWIFLWHRIYADHTHGISIIRIRLFDHV